MDSFRLSKLKLKHLVAEAVLAASSLTSDVIIFSAGYLEMDNGRVSPENSEGL
jgi:hypothetical protein